jgi:hypothetical protein
MFLQHDHAGRVSKAMEAESLEETDGAFVIWSRRAHDSGRATAEEDAAAHGASD